MSQTTRPLIQILLERRLDKSSAKGATARNANRELFVALRTFTDVTMLAKARVSVNVKVE